MKKLLQYSVWITVPFIITFSNLYGWKVTIFWAVGVIAGSVATWASLEE